MNKSLRENIKLKMKNKGYSPNMINIYLDFVSSTKIDNNSKSSRWIMAFGEYVKDVIAKNIFEDIEDITVKTDDGYDTDEYERLKKRHLSTFEKTKGT